MPFRNCFSNTENESAARRHNKTLQPTSGAQRSGFLSIGFRAARGLALSRWAATEQAVVRQRSYTGRKEKESCKRKKLFAPCLIGKVAVVLARYTVHAGALNPIDSAAYGTLLIAEAAIDQVRTENQTGPLPAEATLSSLYI